MSTSPRTRLSAPEPALLTLRQARRIQLRAQGFSSGLPADRKSADRKVGDVFSRLGVLQIDSVTTVTRSHFLPLFSRLGPYSTERLEGLQRPVHTGRDRGLVQPAAVEYWAHEASIVPTELFPALRAVQSRSWVSASDSPEERDALIPDILDLLEESDAPLSSRQLAERLGVDSRRDRGHWGWNWAPLKHALGDLFEKGEVLSAGRNEQFEKTYVPAARLIGEPERLRRPDAVVVLTARALEALGVAETRSIADYYRLSARETAAALESLRQQGRAETVQVEGQSRPWWIAPGATPLRAPKTDALLSPFDSLVFDRTRLAQLWGMEYRLEFYVPAKKRVFGYYVMPFLQGDALTARVDVAFTRKAGVLRVLSAHREAEADVSTAVRLASALRRLADWLGADGIQVTPTGDLGPELRRACQSNVD